MSGARPRRLALAFLLAASLAGCSWTRPTLRAASVDTVIKLETDAP